MGIKLPDGEIMKSLKEAEKYMYLSIIQANQVKHTKKKKKVKREYFLSVREMLEIKVNEENFIKRI